MNMSYKNLKGSQKQIRDELTRITINHGYTFAEIGRKSGVRPDTVCRFVNKEFNIHVNNLVKLYDYILTINQSFVLK